MLVYLIGQEMRVVLAGTLGLSRSHITSGPTPPHLSDGHIYPKNSIQEARMKMLLAVQWSVKQDSPQTVKAHSSNFKLRMSISEVK